MFYILYVTHLLKEKSLSKDAKGKVRNLAQIVSRLLHKKTEGHRSNNGGF